MMSALFTNWDTMIETDEAWCLCSQPSGETSVWVTFFTKKQGLIRALFKGGRLPKKQALIRPFGLLWIQFSIIRTTAYLRQVEGERAPFLLYGQQLFSGLYINELLYSGLRHADPHPVLFDAYETVLRALSQSATLEDLEISLRHFEMTYLAQMGYALNFYEQENGVMILSEAYYLFYPERGFIESKAGFLGADLLAIASGDFSLLGTRIAAKKIIRSAISNLLSGKKMYSRTLFL